MNYDLAVIGGGPAGILGAMRAAELGLNVIILEKNTVLGVKLMITGNGRCNITNNKPDIRQMVNAYGARGVFLYSAFSRFGPEEMISFLSERGLKVKEENEGRVFPESDKAKDVINVLAGYLKEIGVEIKLQSEVERLVTAAGRISELICRDGSRIRAKNYLVATGGKTYPRTGSTGDAYGWLSAIGHAIETPRPALAPIYVHEKFVGELEGLSLRQAEICIYNNGRKVAARSGELVFTRNGLSGPAAHDLSLHIAREKMSDFDLVIDLKPSYDWKQMDKKIQKQFKEGQNRLLKNVLDDFLPPKLTAFLIFRSGIDAGKVVNLVTKEERKMLVRLLKEFRLRFAGLADFEKAVITAGGVSLAEVDPKTMRSKIIKNLFLAGEVLDLEGPSGGYNLQIAWSTGYLAGESAASDQ